MLLMNDLEFSRLVSVVDLEDGDFLRQTIDAGADECVALAKRFAIAKVEGLHADILLRRHGRQVLAETELVAVVEQTCVVSLRPLNLTVEESFTRVFDPDVRPSGEFDETIDLDPDSEDPPEALVDDMIDLGEMVTEQLGLALDPYPRAEGASIDPRYVDVEPPKRDNPFAALKGLKLDG